ncbi:hypothetical protein L9F63_015524, partial [Diploptera punctata]
EYTAEIERLRRDLQATRDKSGVYLANENYTKMITQLEQQEHEISEFLSQIKCLKEEMDKKEVICNQLNMYLEECNKELETTSTKLRVTQEELQDTSKELNDKVNECKEKVHLIERHLQTEHVLTQQAQSLLSVADIATVDTHRLHDKLARKRSVENINDDVTRDFHASFVQNVAHMQDSLNRFTQDDIKFCSGLQTNLGERLEKRSVELASLSNEMSSFVESQTQLIQYLEKMLSNQVFTGQQWIQQFVTTVRSTSDGEVNNLHKFLTETFLVPVRNMARHLKQIGSEIQSSSRTITEMVQQKMDAMKTFESSQKQKQSLDRAEEAFRGIDETTNNYKERVTRGHARPGHNTDNALKDQVIQLKALADNVFAAFGNTESHINDQKAMTSTLEQQVKRRTEEFNNYETQTEEILVCVSNSKETLDQLITGAERLTEELEDGVRAHRQEMRKYSENLNGELQRELKQTQELTTGLRESAESHEAILEQQRIDFGTFVREHQDDLENHCSYLNGWSQTFTSELQLRNQEVDKFLVEDLRKDSPTGNTPQRREFDYPRQLAATSPHERILARFREMNDEALFKNPNDELKDENSFKGRSTKNESTDTRKHDRENGKMNDVEKMTKNTNVSKMEEKQSDKTVKSSSAFFSQLQDEVKTLIKRKTTSSTTGSKNKEPSAKRSTIHDLVTKFETTGPVQNKKHTRRSTVRNSSRTGGRQGELREEETALRAGCETPNIQFNKLT